MAKEYFTITEEHIKLLQNMYLGWSNCEYGAPEVDPKRPYGNSDVEIDIHEILTGEKNTGDEDSGPTDEQRARYAALHRETLTVLQIGLQTLTLKPGKYERLVSHRHTVWEPAP